MQKSYLFRLLRKAAWAPIAVLVFHAVVIRSHHHTETMDHVIHFSGGAAIAFFLFQAIDLLGETIQRTMPFGIKYAFAFAAACTAALFWEFAEFASDQFLDTWVQENVIETMNDLVFGTVGAVCALAIIALVRLGKKD